MELFPTNLGLGLSDHRADSWKPPELDSPPPRRAILKGDPVLEALGWLILIIVLSLLWPRRI